MLLRRKCDGREKKRETERERQRERETVRDRDRDRQRETEKGVTPYLSLYLPVVELIYVPKM